jgi:hypothetical protein
MTVLSRGVRSRRGGRRPGWPLLTALLVLAIAASSALVFTSRIELLKLAVILALWAAVVAAFVSVIYRRQSDVDQAKARDLKLVYDLQLDREISARREYELTVESQLRRELSSELRAQAADEVAALRAELAALRTNLEILFDADLSHRPALETERTTVRAYSDWARDTEITDPGRSWRRFATATRDVDIGTSEDSIIDVPEEPPEPEFPPPAYGGAHRRPSENGGWVTPARPEPRPEPMAEPEPEPQPQPPPPQPQPPAAEWKPVEAQGQWLPPGVPGSNWVSGATENGFGPGHPTVDEPARAGATPEPRLGRHSSSAEPVPGPAPPPQPAPPPPGPPESTARHGSAAETPSGESDRGQGQSVAELLARLQPGSTGGGRRRRRDD